MEYQDMKKRPIYYDNLLGPVTLEELVETLEYYVDKQKKFENIVYDILKNNGFDTKTLSSLFTLSTSKSIELILKMIKDEL